LDFFNIDNRYCLVDLPGYGFARVPDKVKKQWEKLINDYLFYRENLAGIIQIIDARHKPTSDDILMIDWLKEMQIPAIIAATKVDKLSRNKQKKQEKIIKQALNLGAEIEFTFFSALTGTGVNNVRAFISNVLEEMGGQ